MSNVLGDYMKKALLFAGLLLLLVACTSKKEQISDAQKFKDEYESYNGKIRAKNNMENRTITISSDNPFVYLSSDELIKKIEKGEDFYLYFGSPECPWCRSNIEMAIEVSKENDIETIYYLNIWDENGQEIFRDLYDIVNDKLVKKVDGDPNYYKFLEYFDAFLDDYVINDGESAIEVGEKRVYIPLYMHIADSDVIEMTTAQAQSQSDGYMELNDTIKQEQRKQFEKLFKVSTACSIETKC